jgi:hypothetical protein
MNTINALIFAALGFAMEMTPRAFPAWFPPTGSDQASTRALWLALMGWVQVTIALGFVIQAYVVPAVMRLVAFVTGAQPIALPLPSGRGVTPRG